jgi:hypothetical protein
MDFREKIDFNVSSTLICEENVRNLAAAQRGGNTGGLNPYLPQENLF